MIETPWFAGPLTAFDLESTGVDTEQAHIVTAAVIDLGGGRPTVARNWLAAVEIDIPAEATAVHGISTEEARKDGRPAAEVLDEVATLLAASLEAVVPIVGHNVVYDLTLLDRELRRKGLPTLDERSNRQGPVICTRVLDQHCVKYRRKARPATPGVKVPGPRTLQTTALVYGLGWDEQAAHGCESTPPDLRPDWVRAERAQGQGREFFDDLAGIDMADLFIAQQQWAFEQAADLQAYFRQQDPAAVVDGHWPMIPFGGAS